MEEKEIQTAMRLNKYIAHCGICNRRQAVELIKDGLVKVNGEVNTNPATIVQPEDKVSYKGELVSRQEPKRYVLMNKPKNVSIRKDEAVRKSVLDIVQPKYAEKLTPIGALDSMELGLLLLTNDDEVIRKFSVASAAFIRIYHLTLDRPLFASDLNIIKETDTLLATPFEIENINFLDEEYKTEIGIELVRGTLTQLRSLFDSLDYKIEKLDCMNFAKLTKKDLPRGWFRNLSHKEVVLLKHFR